MATHTAVDVSAHVTTEGNETVIRIPGPGHLPSGRVNARANLVTGEMVLTPEQSSSAPTTWAEFFDHMDAQPRDEHWDEFMKVMKERPMNRPPVERDLFPGK